MSTPSLDLPQMLVDIHVERSEIVPSLAADAHKADPGHWTSRRVLML